MKRLIKKNLYIRFGEIPTNEKSGIYKNNEICCGYEKGVSVWDCCIKNNKYHIVLPNPCNEDTIADIETYTLYNDRNIYLVTGIEVGSGSDNEPLLKNVKIIKQLSEDDFN